jgi:predicted alpha/beta superfamily hydrolase
MREFKGKNSNFVAMNLSFYRVFFPLFILFFNLLIPINAEEQQMMPLPTVAYGKIVRFTKFPSMHVQSRTIDVLLPNGYTPKKNYPVIYMHDGQMLFDDARTWNHQEWGVDETLLEYTDSLQPCIIVAISNADTLRRAEYFPEKALKHIPEETRKQFIDSELYGKALGDEYLLFLVKELKPFIEKMFSAFSSPQHNFLMGSSMGGLISLYALCEYPDQFGGIAGLSTHWPGSLIVKDSSIANAILEYLSMELPIFMGGKKIYLDHGTLGLDSLYLPYQERMNALCKSAGYDESQYQFHFDEDADHNEEAWRNRLHFPLQFLLKKTQSAD